MDVSKEKGIPTAYGPESPDDSPEGAFERPAQGPLARKLQGRHMQMIAIGEHPRPMKYWTSIGPLNMSPLQAALLALVFSLAPAHLLSTVVPAVWSVCCIECSSLMYSYCHKACLQSLAGQSTGRYTDDADIPSSY